MRALTLPREALEGLRQEILIFGPDGRVAFANKAMAGACGQEAHELVGKSTREIAAMLASGIDVLGGTPIAEPEIAIDQIGQLLASAANTSFEIGYTDGRRRRVSCYGADGAGSTVIFHDVFPAGEAKSDVPKSDEMARRIVEACPLPLAMSRLKDRKLLYESPANNALFGETPESKATHVGVYDVDPTQRVEYLRRLRRDGFVSDFEIRFRRLDGSEFVGALSAQVIDYKGEEVVISVAVDVTERIEREATLRRILDVSPIPILMYRLPEGKIAYENPAARGLFGTAETAPTAGTHSRWVDRADRERLIGQIYQNKALDSVEVQFKRRDGTRFWGAVSARLVEYRGQDTVIASVFDLTERKAMELALQDSEASVRFILESCPVPIAVIRAEDGHTYYESPASKALFRRTDSSTDNSAASTWVEPEKRREFLARLRDDEMTSGYVIHMVRADGTTFWGADYSRLIEYKGEECMISSIVDLTDRLAAEEEFARQRDALHQSEKLSAMGQLLASVAHELNNPLSVVVGQSLLLQEMAREQEVSERAARIGAAADRCAKIVKTFLAMARQQPKTSTFVNPNELIEAALEVTAYSLRTSGIDVSTTLAPSLPQILVDTDQVTQVFTNLIVNAEHALRGIDGPRLLRISSRLSGANDHIVFKVKDTGPGVPKDIRARIFEPFYTTKEEGSGTGIGLALCHRILETHGGRIKLDTTSVDGATFVVRLPVKDNQSSDREEQPFPTSSEGILSVLVIDDEEDFTDLLLEILESEGHEVQVANSGRQALGLINQGQFDVILSDIRMPDMDGLALYRSVEVDRPELLSRFAFITGDILTGENRAFLELAGRHHIDKPVTPEDVRQLVRKVIES